MSRQHLFWRRSDTEIVRLLQGRAVCGFTLLCTPLGLAIQAARRPNHLGLFQAKSDLAFVSPLTAMFNVGGDHQQETRAGAIGRLHLIHLATGRCDPPHGAVGTRAWPSSSCTPNRPSRLGTLTTHQVHSTPAICLTFALHIDMSDSA